MTKELLTIEFRYRDKPKSEWDGGHRNKTITVGVFDTLDEAIIEGNKALAVLSKRFEVRADDRFDRTNLGSPLRLVTNTCYPTKGVQYFAKIQKLNFDNLEQSINEAFEASERYRDFDAQQA